ncbi:MAG: NAD(P)H-dependent oxidoreductase [Pseudomonadota bacterium]
MAGKRIFVLNGHPGETSLSRSIAETYVKAAQAAGHEVRLTHLRDLAFDPDHGAAGYTKVKPLEPDLAKLRADIEWSEHWVLCTPMWWGGMPAKLKGLFDRTFLPGWAFDPQQQTKSGMPLPLLTGRSARAFVTSDTPTVYFGLLYHKALLRQIRGQIFSFCGMRPARVSHFAPASHPKEGAVDGWLRKVAQLGAQAK